MPLCLRLPGRRRRSAGSLTSAQRISPTPHDWIRRHHLRGNATNGVSPGIALDKGTLRAFNPAGMLKWSVEVGPTLKAAPAVAPDGTVYIPGMTGLLYAVTPAPEGQQAASVKWAFDFGAHLGPTPLVTSEVPVAGGDALGSGASATIGPDG